jgi:hypothetical protein
VAAERLLQRVGSVDAVVLHQVDAILRRILVI